MQHHLQSINTINQHNQTSNQHPLYTNYTNYTNHEPNPSRLDDVSCWSLRCFSDPGAVRK
jgi:hypothetical protein